MRKYLSFLLLLLTCHLAAHNKIQIVLTNPRSVSTAFEKSMMARNDHKIFHEPWGVSHLYHQGLLHSLPPVELREAKGYEEVKELIYRSSLQKPVFLKDMVWCLANDILNDTSLLSDPDVTLTLLIRDPALSMESFVLKGADMMGMENSLKFTAVVFRYDQLVQVAEKYKEVRGEWPIIVEAEELCSEPEKVLQHFCNQAQIPYIASVDQWTAEVPDEWKHLAAWHLDAANSKGFYVPKRDKSGAKFANMSPEHVPFLMAIDGQQRPFYEQLRAMKK